MPQIKLQIPSDAEEGDLLTCHYNGNDFEIPVPAGSKAGDVLQIQLAEDNDVMKSSTTTDQEECSTSGKEDVTGVVVEMVALHESVGVTLEMYNSIPPRGQDDDETGRKKEETWNPTNADGTNAMVWPAGRYLAECISSPTLDDLVNKSMVVVELGSGLGVGGLAFAATVSRRLAKRKRDVKNVKVILTDLPPALPLLRFNVEQNKHKMSSNSSSENIMIQPFEWKNSIPSFLQEKDAKGGVDLVIASDLLYNTSLRTYKDLVSAIDSTLTGGSVEESNKASGGKIILSVRWRKPQEERIFFKLMEAKGYFFDLQKACQPVGSDLTWQEYGDPSCTKSNEFFTYTKVKINGELKALKDIDEQDMDNMDDQEFEAFESKFLQIYIGEKR